MAIDSNSKAKEAISAALEGNWEKALKINEEILKENPEDIEALARLAKAYSETKDIKKAKETAKRILTIDPYNIIAQKCLKKWKKSQLKKNNYTKSCLKADLFIEEPGKTKIVKLIHPGNSKTLAELDPGDELKMKIHGHRINITTFGNEYVGRLPDDINSRLKKLIKLGNEYQVFIKSIEDNDIKVFIKETKKTKKTKKLPSFVIEKIDYISFTPPELTQEKEELSIESERDIEDYNE